MIDADRQGSRSCARACRIIPRATLADQLSVGEEHVVRLGDPEVEGERIVDGRLATASLEVRRISVSRTFGARENARTSRPPNSTSRNASVPVHSRGAAPPPPPAAGRRMRLWRKPSAQADGSWAYARDDRQHELSGGVRHGPGDGSSAAEPLSVIVPRKRPGGSSAAGPETVIADLVVSPDRVDGETAARPAGGGRRRTGGGEEAMARMREPYIRNTPKSVSGIGAL